MLVLRCTGRLLQRLASSTVSVPPRSTTRLGDWYATLLTWRPRHLVLLVNEATRIPVILPARPLSTLTNRATGAIADVLRELGVDPAAVDDECREMAEVVHARTASRSVLGTINEFAFHLEALHASRSAESEHKLSLLLGDMLVTVPPLGFEYPGEVVLKWFDSETRGNGTIPRPPGPRSDAVDRQIARVLQVKVTLLGIQPPIWRRIRTRSDVPLDMFHRTLQVVMGWSDTHLHEFLSGRERIGPLEEAPDLFTARESMRTVGRILRTPGDKLMYLYDPGDSWAHEILLEQVLEPEVAVGYPRVIDGAGACPPEDSGGPAGYAEILHVLADDTHADHDETRRFVGDSFDPDGFDPQAVNAELAARHLVWPRPNPPARPAKTKPRLQLVRGSSPSNGA